MRAPLLLIPFVLALTMPSLAQAASVTTTLSVSVSRSCLIVSGGAAPGLSTSLVLKCNSGSAAPQNPLEVVAAPVADWQLTAHASSPDGGELFTYTRRLPTVAALGASASVDFY